LEDCSYLSGAELNQTATNHSPDAVRSMLAIITCVVISLSLFTVTVLWRIGTTVSVVRDFATAIEIPNVSILLQLTQLLANLLQILPNAGQHLCQRLIGVCS